MMHIRRQVFKQQEAAFTQLEKLLRSSRLTQILLSQSLRNGTTIRTCHLPVFGGFLFTFIQSKVCAEDAPSDRGEQQASR